MYETHLLVLSGRWVTYRHDVALRGGVHRHLKKTFPCSFQCWLQGCYLQYPCLYLASLGLSQCGTNVFCRPHQGYAAESQSPRGSYWKNLPGLFGTMVSGGVDHSWTHSGLSGGLWTAAACFFQSFKLIKLHFKSKRYHDHNKYFFQQQWSTTVVWQTISKFLLLVSLG